MSAPPLSPLELDGVMIIMRFVGTSTPCKLLQARAARLSREKEAAARQQAAVFLQGWWHRLQARRMLSGRCAYVIMS